MDVNWEERPPSKYAVSVMTEIKSSIMLLQNNLENLTKSLAEMKADNAVAHTELLAKIEKMSCDNKNDFVNKEEFKPIRMIVYGMVGSTLVAILTAVIAIVIKQ